MRQITDSIFLYLSLTFLILIITPLTPPKVLGQQLNRVIVEEVTARGTDTTSLPPFRGPVEIRDFFNYYEGSPNTGLEKKDAFVVIPYKSPSGTTSLIILVDDPTSSSGGEAELRIRGLPGSSYVALFDGPPANYSFSPPIGNFRWNWNPEEADGVIISGLEDEFELEIEFQPIENVSGGVMISGNLKSPESLVVDEGAKVQVSGVASVRSPKTRFTCPRVVRTGKEVEFDASKSIDPDGRIVQYSWDFDGDGFYSFVSQKPTANHTFIKSGTHTVNLRITTDFGNGSVRQKTVKVTRNPIKATRHLSTEEVLPNEKVKVRVEILARQEVSGVGLEENLPKGWDVKFQGKEGITWKPSTNQWLLNRRMEPGETIQISYTLLSPSSPKLDQSNRGTSIKLSGKVSSASPEFSKAVAGESRLGVTSSVKPLTALAHYDLEARKIDFELSGKITERQLKAALGAWKRGGKLPYLGGMAVGFELIKKAALYHQKGAKVSEEISEPGVPEVEVRRSINTGLPDNALLLDSDNPWSDRETGAVKFRVTVKVSPENRTLMGFGVDEKIPKSWKVTSESGEGVVFKPATNRWVVRRPILPDENFTINYRVKVPLKFSIGKHLLNGEIEEGWSGNSITIRGDHSLRTVNKLPPSVVISRWNVEKGKLDLTMNNYITSSQSEKAISFWVKGLVVPFTGGKKITFSSVKEIMALHLEKEPIKPSY